jgi:predicted DNA-binding WGR domain protein
MYYEFKDDKSNKFWEINENPKNLSAQVNFGKIGTKGRIKDFYFSNIDELKNFIDIITAPKNIGVNK